MMWHRRAAVAVTVVMVAAFAPMVARAAPFAAVVMDMRSGEILHARNHDTRLHPASLTKMMTLYIAFEAIRNGEITLDTPVRVSANAAGQPCSCLGLRAGQTIALRYLIRAAALRSGNDAATAIGEAISGSEAAFIARMNRTAAAMGMNNTSFRNAHGLTASGHLSTARDMTTLGRQLYFDFPEYYNLFSRRSADAGIATVPNTNRAFLNSYDGADGIKTGFTRAAGFNLTASAQRGDRRIIVTLFGGQSVPDRTRRVTELMNTGFARAPANAPTRPPSAPNYGDRPPGGVAMAAATPSRGTQTAVRRSPLPPPRPAPVGQDTALAALEAGVAAALASTEADLAVEAQPPAGRPEVPPEDLPFAVADAGTPAGPDSAEQARAAALEAVVPEPRPADLPDAHPALTATDDTLPFAIVDIADIAAEPDAPADLPFALAADPGATEPEGLDPQQAPIPPARPSLATDTDQVPDMQVARADAPEVAPPAALDVPPMPDPFVVLTFSAAQDSTPPAGVMHLAAAGQAAAAVPVRSDAAALPGTPATGEVVLTQVSTSDARLWGVNIGRFGTRDAAERALMRAALAELSSFDSALRRVRNAQGGFEATFVGLSETEARIACARLEAHDRNCTPITP